MYTKIIRFLFYALFIATPLIMNSSTSELFEFNKMLFIYMITVLIALLWAIEVIIYKKKIIHNRVLSGAMLLFLLSQVLSTLFSIDVHTSIFGYYGRFNGGLLSIISYIVLFYAFLNHFDRRSALTLLTLSCISSVAVILWGLPGRFGNDLSCYVFSGQFTNSCWTDQFRPAERMFSTLGQPNWLGAYLAIHFFIGMYFLEERLSKLKKGANWQTVMFVMWVMYEILVFSGVLFTKSRSAMGSVMVGAAIAPLFVFAVKKNLKEVSILCGVVFMAILVPVLVYKTGVASVDKYLTLSTYINRPVEMKSEPQPQPAVSNQTVGFNTDVTDSFVIRKIVWKGAQELGMRYPLFGTGVETFAYAYYFVRPQIHNLTSEWDYLYNKAHNEYLNYFATTGFVGIATYLIMIAAVFWIAWKAVMIHKHEKKHPVANIALYATLAYISILVTNVFGFSITIVNLFFYGIPALLLVTMMSEDTDRSPERRYAKLNRYQIALLASASLVAVYMLTFIVNYLYADIKYSAADKYGKGSDYQSAANLMQDALDMHYEHVYEDKLSYYLANLSYAAAYQKEKDASDKLLQLSELYNSNSLKASPKNMLYWKTKVKNDYLFYQISLNPGYLKDGIEGLTTAAAIAPTDSKIPYSLSLFYSLLEDEEKDADAKVQLQNQAISAINKAIELKPDYRDSYYLKGQLQKKFGDTEGARTTFQFILDKINPQDSEAKKELEAL